MTIIDEKLHNKTEELLKKAEEAYNNSINNIASYQYGHMDISNNIYVLAGIIDERTGKRVDTNQFLDAYKEDIQVLIAKLKSVAEMEEFSFIDNKTEQFFNHILNAAIELYGEGGEIINMLKNLSLEEFAIMYYMGEWDEIKEMYEEIKAELLHKYFGRIQRRKYDKYDDELRTPTGKPKKPKIKKSKVTKAREDNE